MLKSAPAFHITFEALYLYTDMIYTRCIFLNRGIKEVFNVYLYTGIYKVRIRIFIKILLNQNKKSEIF